MAENSMAEKALQLTNKVIYLGIEGEAPGMKSSAEVAGDYLRDTRFHDNDERIRSLIRWHVAQTGTTGFVTGLGGLLAHARNPSLPLVPLGSFRLGWLVR